MVLSRCTPSVLLYTSTLFCTEMVSHTLLLHPSNALSCHGHRVAEELQRNELRRGARDAHADRRVTRGRELALGYGCASISAALCRVFRVVCTVLKTFWMFFHGFVNVPLQSGFRAHKSGFSTFGDTEIEKNPVQVFNPCCS